jgi:HipA-like protein
MKDLIRKIFNKVDDDSKSQSFLDDQIDSAKFILHIGNVEIGYLTKENQEWVFQYSEGFKKQEKYDTIPGFSDLNKIYRSEDLWPFFKIRIPGLKQPMIKEIIEREKIDIRNEVQLLKRFGKRIISDPYILEF